MHLLIYNPVSGNSGDELVKIVNLFGQYNMQLQVALTQEHQPIVDILETYKNSVDTVVVAGGDGTISQVIDALKVLDMSASLLIYPRGTTNEYASTIGITKNTLEAYLKGECETKFVDLGSFNEDNMFTYSFVFGNFSHITYETPQWLKNRLGYIAYWIYGFMSLYILKLKRYRMKFEFNDEVLEGDFMFGSISNSHTLGRIINLNDVSFSDGLLELVIVSAPKSLRDIRYFLGDARTGENTSGLLIQKKVESVVVSSPKKHSWSADGEFSGRFDHLEVKVSKAALKIIK